MKDFVKASLEHFRRRKGKDDKLRALVFMLPIATNLFEGLGEKDEFVKTCAEAFKEDPEAR